MPCFLSCFSRVWLSVTPWTVARQASLSMESSRQDYWSGLPFPSPGDLLDPGIEIGLLPLLHWQADSLPLALPGSPHIYIYIYIYICIDKSDRIERDKDKNEEWIHRIFFNIGIYYRAIKIQAIACDELLAHQHYLLFILFYLLFLYL